MPALPPFLQRHLEKLLEDQLRDSQGRSFDFRVPRGAEALLQSNSVSWRVFSNPVSLLIGGITAVILELAEPRVRTGVWEHTAFRTEPLARMRRTGLAAMITVYAPKEAALKMIAGVRRMHHQVQGSTHEGIAYRANDPELLNWVHGTACFGFLQAYHHYVGPLSVEERDRFYAEGAPVARLYGADGSPQNEAEFQHLLDHFTSLMEPSAILQEFVQIMEKVELIPGSYQLFNPIFIAAAVDLLPSALQKQLGLDHYTLNPLSRTLLRSSAKFMQSLQLSTGPYLQSLKRMGISVSDAMR